MKYCTVCEKLRETHIRVTRPKWHWKLENSANEYVREVCLKCQSPLLIDSKPNFDVHVKVSKRDKRAEKRFNQMRYRVTNWPSIGW